MRPKLDKTILFLIGGILFFIILRFPSLYEPHWYGDEGIYAAVSYEMSHDEMLYRDIWDDKPPLIYWTFLLAGNMHKLFFARLFNLIAGVLTIVGIFKLTEKLFDKRLALVSFFFSILLLGLPILEGNIANGENFFLPLMVWGYFLALSSIKKKGYQFLVGLFFGLATLYKVIALFDFGAIALYLIATETKIFSKKPKIKGVTKLLPICIGFVLPILATITVELINNNFSNFIHATLLDMFSYVGYTTSNKLIALSTKAKILLLLAASAILIFNFYSKKLSKRTFFIALVLLYEYFATIISDRHYIHYLLQVIPGFILLTVYVVNSIQDKKLLISKINAIIIFILGIYLALINFTQGEGLKTNYGAWQFQDKPSYYKTYAYYKNFLNYKVLHRISEDEYNHLFNDEETKIITLKRTLNAIFSDIENNNIYIYTNRAWTYPYLDIQVPAYFSVAYHRYIKENGNNILINDLGNSNPQLIVVERGIPTFDEFDLLLLGSYDPVIEDEIYSYYRRQ